MYDIFVRKARIFEKVLDDAAIKGKLQNFKQRTVLRLASGETVDMQAKFYSFTMDSIEEIFFGIKQNTLEGQMSEFGRSFDAAQNELITCAFTFTPFFLLSDQMLPYPFGNLLPRQGDPLKTWLMRFVTTFSPSWNRFKKLTTKLDLTVRKMIDEAYADPSLNERKDIMARFATAKLSDGSTLDKQSLRDIVLNLTLAGRDTT